MIKWGIFDLKSFRTSRCRAGDARRRHREAPAFRSQSEEQETTDGNSNNNNSTSNLEETSNLREEVIFLSEPLC